MTKKQTRKVALEDIIVRYDLYPRLPEKDENSSQSFAAVRSYMTAIEELPPIVVTQENVLVDGWHRLEAYKMLADEMAGGGVDEDIALSKGFNPKEIEVEVRDIAESEVLLESTRINAHGQVVMTREEKRGVAERLSERYPNNVIAEALGIPERTVDRWTKAHRETILKKMQKLVFHYADKHPEMKQTEVRTAILDEYGLDVPRSTHSDWLRDRQKIEKAWAEPPTPKVKVAPKEGEESKTYQQYIEGIEGGKSAVAKLLPATKPKMGEPEGLKPYICDGYKPESAIAQEEYLQTGCLRCQRLRTPGTHGLWEISVECTKGFAMTMTGLKRDR